MTWDWEGQKGREQAERSQTAMAQREDSLVMLSTFASLSVNSAKRLDTQRARPFAAAQGDNEGAINRPLQMSRFMCFMLILLN